MMKVVSDLNEEIERLEKRRDRLRADIGRQERLLAALRGEVAVAQRNQASDTLAAFEDQVRALPGWWQWSRRGLIESLRVRARWGEEIDNVRCLVKDASRER